MGVDSMREIGAPNGEPSTVLAPQMADHGLNPEIAISAVQSTHGLAQVSSAGTIVQAIMTFDCVHLVSPNSCDPRAA